VTGRLIAIGDIHGCRDALRSLLTAIGPRKNDTIITLGDYIDRGSDSRGVIELLIDLKSRCNLIPILGNHEEMMLRVLRGEQPHQAWLQFGGVETLESYGFNGDLNFLPDEHAEFFESLVEYYEVDNFFFTHGAYDPQVPLASQTAEMLRWHSLRDGVPDRHFTGATAIVGHTADKEGEVFDVGHLICIDTYCYGGGYLTGLDVRKRAVWQVTRDGYLR
jgi:serine/threonine protein phosphatase 1